MKPNYRTFMKQLFLFCTLISMFTGCAQSVVSANDRSEQVEKTLPLEAFNAMDVNGMFDIKVVTATDGAYSATLKGSSKRISAMKVSVKNGTLRITPAGLRMNVKTNKHKDEQGVTVVVRAPLLNRVKLSGMVSAHLSALSGNRLRVAASGMSSLSVDKVSGTLLDVASAGMAHCKFSGSVSQAVYEVSGMAEVKADELSVGVVQASASGMATLRCAANRSLTAVSSGMANIYYKGEPTEKHLNASGMSEIKQK